MRWSDVHAAEVSQVEKTNMSKKNLISKVLFKKSNSYEN